MHLGKGLGCSANSRQGLLQTCLRASGVDLLVGYFSERGVEPMFEA